MPELPRTVTPEPWVNYKDDEGIVHALDLFVMVYEEGLRWPRCTVRPYTTHKANTAEQLTCLECLAK